MNVAELFRSSGTHVTNEQKNRNTCDQAKRKIKSIKEDHLCESIKCVAKGSNNISFL